jgi:peptide/nickel transport system substrate-binding protein
MTRNIDHSRLGRLRQGQGEIANHIIDEFAAGRLSRRDFIRRGTVVGISVPLLGSILAACSSNSSTTATSGTSSSATGAPGAVIKAGITTPTAAINPVTVADQGGLDMLAQTGEYLCLSGQNLQLTPVLATSWTPNSTADVWTFKIRQGVKFHNGAALTADDVVYSLKLQAAPGASAASAFAGALKPSGVVKVDDFTVAFHLEAPNGNFPYLVSSDNYNVIIIPNNYDPAKWQSSFIGTGPFVLGSYTPKSGATFTRNESYWGTKALPSQTQFTFYDTQNPAILALTGGTIDVVGQFSVTGAQELLNNSSYNIIKLKSSAHRELSMRCDQAPFNDPRVRQAIALTLDRSAIVKALFKGYADVGNDSPFAPVYPSTNTSVAQRAQNISQAKSLLSAAGHPGGFSTQLITENLLEIPQYAQIVAAAAAQIGVKISLKVESSSAYYGKATFGTSDWLDATMSLVDYGHRSVPNAFLTSALETPPPKGNGVWNAAHFANTPYDKLAAQYVAASDVSTQRGLAGQIETLLLAQTPVIFGYFYNYLTATASGVTGVYPTAIGHLFLYNAAKG